MTALSSVGWVDVIAVIWLLLNNVYYGYHMIDYSLNCMKTKTFVITSQKKSVKCTLYTQEADTNDIQQSDNIRVYCCCCLGKYITSFITWNRTKFIRNLLRYFITMSSIFTFIFIMFILLNIMIQYFLVFATNILYLSNAVISNVFMLLINLVCIPMLYYTVKFILFLSYSNIRISWKLNCDVIGETKQENSTILFGDTRISPDINDMEFIGTYWRFQFFLCTLICSTMSIMFNEQPMSISIYFLLFMCRFMMFGGFICITVYCGCSIILSVLFKINACDENVSIYYIFLLCNNNNDITADKYWTLFKCIFMILCIIGFVLCTIIGLALQDKLILFHGILFISYYGMNIFLDNKPSHLISLLKNEIPQHIHHMDDNANLSVTNTNNATLKVPIPTMSKVTTASIVSEQDDDEKYQDEIADSVTKLDFNKVDDLVLVLENIEPYEPSIDI